MLPLYAFEAVLTSFVLGLLHGLLRFRYFALPQLQETPSTLVRRAYAFLLPYVNKVIETVTTHWMIALGTLTALIAIAVPPSARVHLLVVSTTCWSSVCLGFGVIKGIKRKGLTVTTLPAKTADIGQVDAEFADEPVN